MTLPRPKLAPERIPLWAWHLNAWLDSGKQGRRPRHAPKRVPAWFWIWRLYTLAKHERQGSRAWKNYMKALNALPDPAAAATALRARIVRWARYYAAHEPQVGYTQSTSRDDFLHYPRGHLPQSTDCSGMVTEVTWDASTVPGTDPSGFGYRYVGFTGTILNHAYRHGRVFTNLALARPGDPIVIGPGTGWHAVLVLEAGRDPLVLSHGDADGPKIYRCSVDPRQPKRVCQTLP